MKNRKENRLKKQRYFNPGYYYITLRTYHKRHLFGEIINGFMFKNSIGDMLERVIRDIPKYYNGFDVDEFIIMPNHIHLIIEIVSNFELNRSGKPLEVSRTKPQKPFRTDPQKQLSLFDVMGRFKSMTSNEYLKIMKLIYPNTIIGKLWHRSYYDRVIRDEEDLNRIREYINDNPMNWGNKKGT